MNEIVQKTVTLVRSQVPLKSNYIDYQQDLRRDFWYSCAYCSVTEIEAQGIGFQIDHYLSQATHPDLKNHYYNLMWSCTKCNRFKGDYCPDEVKVQSGYIIIRPDEDDPRNYFSLNEYELEHKNETGKFNLIKLDLNREQLRRVRELRAELTASQNFIAFGVSELLSLSLDSITKNHRAVFKSQLDKLRDTHEQLTNSIEELIKGLAQSNLLDEDLNKPERMKQRREYLSDIDALTPDYKIQKARQRKASNRQKRSNEK